MTHQFNVPDLQFVGNEVREKKNAIQVITNFNVYFSILFIDLMQ